MAKNQGQTQYEQMLFFSFFTAAAYGVNSTLYSGTPVIDRVDKNSNSFIENTYLDYISRSPVSLSARQNQMNSNSYK